MSINVKYFASLAETLNKSEDSIPFTDGLTVTDIWERLNPGKKLLPNTICSVDFEYTDTNYLVSDKAEVAFFPPVTGG